MTTENQNTPTNDTITLKYPFKNGVGETISELPAPAPIKVKVMRKAQRFAQKDPALMELMMVAESYEMTVEDLEEVCLADYEVLRDRFQQVNGVTEQPDNLSDAGTDS